MRRVPLCFSVAWLAIASNLWVTQSSAQEPFGRVTPTVNRVEAFRGASFGVPVDTLSDVEDQQMFSSWGNLRELDWSVGNVGFRPSINYEARYSDNILENAGQQLEDFIHTISPRLSLEVLEAGATEGSFNYSPSFRFFQDNSDQDTVNHLGSFSLAHGWQRLTVFAGADFALSEDPLLEGGVRSRRSTWSVNAGADYLLSGRITGGVNVQRSVRAFNQGFDTESIQGNVNLTYDLGPRTDIGLQFGIGDETSDGAADSIFQEGLLTVQYQIAGKLTASLQGGIHARQFSGAASNFDFTAPILSAALQWRPRESTAVTLDASRRVQASNFVADNADITTTFGGSLRQTLFLKWELGVAAGVGLVEAETLQAGVAAAQNRGFLFANLSANYLLGSRWRVGAFYNYRKREANSSVVGSTVNETGVQISVTF